MDFSGALGKSRVEWSVRGRCGPEDQSLQLVGTRRATELTFDKIMIIVAMIIIMFGPGSMRRPHRTNS